MKVETTETFLDEAYMRVRKDGGRVAIEIGCSGKREEARLKPDGAVALRNTFMGDTEKSEAYGESGDAVTAEYADYDESGFMFTVRYRSLKVRLSSEEAMAAAFAIERCVAAAMSEGPEGVPEGAPEGSRSASAEDGGYAGAAPTEEKVWVLSARGFWKDSRAGGLEMCGAERVFRTEEAAGDALREFMRFYVCGCETDEEFGKSSVAA